MVLSLLEKAYRAAEPVTYKLMARSEYEKSLEILKELEAGDRRYGLFSCFGVLPSGQVVYFDEGGMPCRVYARGTALVRGNPLELQKNQPIEVISDYAL